MGGWLFVEKDRNVGGRHSRSLVEVSETESRNTSSRFASLAFRAVAELRAMRLGDRSKPANEDHLKTGQRE
jgi:hypothetical protein